MCYDAPTGACFPREELCYELYSKDDSDEAAQAICDGLGSEYQPDTVCPEKSLGGCLTTIDTDAGQVEQIQWWYLTERSPQDPALPTTEEQVRSICDEGRYLKK
jgi:hypothetical protein